MRRLVILLQLSLSLSFGLIPLPSFASGEPPSAKELFACKKDLHLHFTKVDPTVIEEHFELLGLDPKNIAFRYFAGRSSKGKLVKIEINLREQGSLLRQKVIGRLEATRDSIGKKGRIDRVEIDPHYRDLEIERLAIFAAAKLFEENGVILTKDSSPVSREHDQYWKYFKEENLTQGGSFLPPALENSPEINSYYLFFKLRATEVRNPGQIHLPQR